ncbi:hypothetical protein niasHT_025158 [Heterodera trifolii]|uniref:Uncharacterized protein n=1 Tax=Heterodera trifolii TaxID=157864 RepID=A0ABD2JLA6_9BILA
MHITVSALFSSEFMKNMLEASNLKGGQRTGNHEAGHAGGCGMNPSLHADSLYDDYRGSKNKERRTN